MKQKKKSIQLEAILLCSLFLLYPVSATTNNLTPKPPAQQQVISEYTLIVANHDGKVTANIKPVKPEEQKEQPLQQPDKEFTQLSTPQDASWSCGNPSVLDLNRWYYEFLDFKGDEDWFKFSLPLSGTFVVSLTVPTNRDYDMAVYRSCGGPEVCNSRKGRGVNEQCSIQASPGDYVVKVNGYNNDYGSEKYLIYGSLASKKPDLAGYGISTIPESVNDQTPFRIKYQTVNWGSTAGRFYVQLFVNNDLRWTCDHQQGLLQEYYSWCETDERRLPAGTYTLKTVADSERWIDESNENNNIETIFKTVSQTAKPDLAGYGMVVTPDTPNDQTEVKVKYQTINKGKVNAGRFTTSLFLDNQVKGTCNFNSGLAFGYYSHCEANLGRLNAGTYTLKTIADSNYDIVEEDENNNIESLSKTVASTGKPDLTFHYIWTNPGQLNDEREFQLLFSTINKGKAYAHPFRTTVYLNDSLYTYCEHDKGLKPGYSQECSRGGLRLPAGHYLIRSVADSEKQVDEEDENNNVYSIGMIVDQSSFPELVISEFNVFPNTLVEGVPFEIQAEIENLGPGPAGSFFTDIYQGTLGDTIILKRCLFQGVLKPGGKTVCKTDSLTRPAGSYRFRTATDIYWALKGDNKHNNGAEKVVTVESTKPDLNVSGINVVPPNPTEDQAVSIEYFTTNIGGKKANSFATSLQIGQGGSFSTIQTCEFYEGLLPNWYGYCRIDNLNLRAGTWQVKVVADSRGDVVEKTKDNNQKTDFISVKKKTSTPYDIYPDAIITVPDNLESETSFDATIRFKNTYGTSTPQFQSGLWAGNDLLISCKTSISTQGECTRQGLTLPAGQHRLLMKVDTNNDVEETNNDNNQLLIIKDVKKKINKPDLQVINIREEQELKEGTASPFIITIANSGGRSGQSRAGIWVDHTLRDTFAVPAMNAFYADTIRHTLQGIPFGDHDLTVRTDINNDVNEINESNNERTKTFRWGKSRCDIPDGSSAVCDCNQHHDCPPSHPYCEDEYQPPINEGFDACLTTTPLFCGDGICNNGESPTSCTKDCPILEKTVMVSVVNQQKKPIQTARVTISGRFKTTDQFGKAQFQLSSSQTHHIKTECPDQKVCDTSSFYLGESNRTLQVTCRCPEPGDSDSDGFPDLDEQLVGTDVHDSNSNLKASLTHFSNECLMLPPFLSGLLTTADIITIAQASNTFGIEAASEQILELAGINQSLKVADSRTLIEMAAASEYIHAFGIGNSAVVAIQDADSGVTSFFLPRIGCQGFLIGIVHGAGTGLIDDIQSLPDLLKLAVSSIAHLVREKIDIINGVKTVWETIATAFSRVNDLFYSMAIPVFQSGKSVMTYIGKRPESLSRTDYHDFQVGFFKGHMTGYISEQVGINYLVPAKILAVLSGGIIIQKIASPITRWLSRFARLHGDDIARILEKADVVKIASAWRDEAAEAGLARYARLSKSPEKVRDAVANTDAKTFFKNFERAGSELGDAFTSRLLKSEWGGQILSRWSPEEVSKFGRVLRTFEKDDHIKLIWFEAGWDTNRLKHVNTFFDTKTLAGKPVYEALNKKELFEISQKISRHMHSLLEDIPDLTKHLISAEDFQDVIRGADVLFSIKDTHRGLKNTNWFLKGKKNDVIPTIKSLGALQDVDGVKILAGDIIKGTTGHPFEAIFAAHLKKQGYELVSLTRKIKGITDYDIVFKNKNGKTIVLEAKDRNWFAIQNNKKAIEETIEELKKKMNRWNELQSSPDPRKRFDQMALVMRQDITKMDDLSGNLLWASNEIKEMMKNLNIQKMDWDEKFLPKGGTP